MIYKVELFNFRNITELQLKFERGLNLLIGENGQGKTNIIESIYFLTKGQSFRPGKNDNFIKRGDDRASLIAIIEGRKRRDEVKLKFLDDKKKFEINNKKTSPINVSKFYSNVFFSSECLSAIKEGPDKGRYLMDDFLISHIPESLSIISDYKKCLLSRNKILRNYKKGFISLQECEDLLESLQSIFLELSTELTWSRIKSLNDISPLFIKSFRKISESESIEVKIDYLISSQSSLYLGKKEIYHLIQERLNQKRKTELATGLTLVGPHKHALKFLYQGEDSRYFCSQGQQRTLILSFKMAQIMYYYKTYGEYPILLLDDVLSELDERRRNNLIGFLSSIDSQIFITTADTNLPSVLGSQIKTFKIKSGGIIVN